MVNTITVRNVNEALPRGLQLLECLGIGETSRNGTVIVFPDPVVTEYSRPWERVLFSQVRDANPCFHLMESLWMLGGRNDLAFLQEFVSTFGQFSDDGVTLHGAYGHRWRTHFDIDQLGWLVEELKQNPDSRRAVLQMWDATADIPKLSEGGKDVPCNVTAFFDRRGGVLNMTVCNRSNDMIWGAYGANAVHFSFLLEYMAAAVGVPMGKYRQFSNNLHVYPGNIGAEKMRVMKEEDGERNPYSSLEVYALPLVDEPATFLLELGAWFEWGGEPPEGYVWANKFLSRVASPMLRWWRFRKRGMTSEAWEAVNDIAAPDWRRACIEWSNRREKK